MGGKGGFSIFLPWNKNIKSLCLTSPYALNYPRSLSSKQYECLSGCVWIPVQNCIYVLVYHSFYFTIYLLDYHSTYYSVNPQRSLRIILPFIYPNYPPDTLLSFSPYIYLPFCYY